MGIPKFYRWLSERYPLIGQSIATIPELDNLYLDMNGIIHTSSHSNTLSHLIPHLSSTSEFNDMWRKVFAYIEMIFQLVKPKKLLYLALDGVAPRAKMNNQRERRYKFIYEVNEFISKERKGGRRTVDDWFDSCNISPGTDFMRNLNNHIKSFIKWKILNDENWRKVKVVFSGSDVPGEGEHKIMKYIRNNKGVPNVRHCIYGLDADLILLGLITHEPYVVILREEVNIGSVRSLPTRKHVTDTPKFECLYINLLREYLSLEFSIIDGLDFERFIDDFVVLMLFIGNDFIPRLPTFEINEGAVDKLFELYKQNWKRIGYLSDSGFILWGALEAFFVEFPEYEKDIISNRIKSSKPRNREVPIAPTKKALSIKEIVSSTNRDKEEVKEDPLQELGDSRATIALKEALNNIYERGIDQLKNFYYSTVLGFDMQSTGEKIKEMVLSYLEGLQWVMLYYFQGVSDWQWYYPFHYAPMISDFLGIPLSCRPFEYKAPYKALEQLLIVIPPSSKKLLPSFYANIMDDPDLKKYFPIEPIIEYDPMCAKIGWESLKIKVPFVPYELIQEKTRTFPNDFENNSLGEDIVYEYNSREPTQFVQSSVPELIPDFDCSISEALLTYPQISTFKAALVPNTASKIGGFPSLHYLSFNSELRVTGIFKFQSSSSHPSLILNFEQSPLTLKQAYETYYDKVCYFEYPHNELGKVIGVSNSEEIIPKISREDLDYYQMSEAQYINSIISSLQDQLLFQQGILIKPSLGIVIHYYPLLSIKRTLKGKYVPEWKSEESYAPLELTTFDGIQGNPRHLNPPSTLSEEFPIGSRVIIVKKERMGGQGEVVGYNNQNVQVRIIKKPKSIISEIYKLASFHEEKYYSVREIAQKLKKPIGLINKVMSSIKIKFKLPGKIKILEIGLNLKHDRDYVSVLRWARWGGYWQTSEDWEYSPSALKIMQDYIDGFPQLWKEFENCWQTNRKNFQFEDLFRYSNNPGRELERVALWICKLPTHKEPWASLYSQYLCESVIENIEKLALVSQNELLDEIQSLNPNHLFIASKPWCPIFTDKVIEFKLGHRVINLNPDFYHYIPFGAEGTIVALLDTQHAEVLWDDFIIKSRKLVVPTINLLNLTTPIIIIKRGGIEKMPLFRTKTHDDLSFKPDIFKKKFNETPEEIIAKALKDCTLNEPKLNPNAAEFSLPAEKINLLPPSGFEFPPPSFSS